MSGSWKPLTMDDVLMQASEEEVFELAFGYRPEEGQRVTSPFREDRNPGCRFWRGRDGRLRFTDHAHHHPVVGSTMDCFAAVQARFGLHGYAHALDFAQQVLSASPQRESHGSKQPPFGGTGNGGGTRITFRARPFEARDAPYWKKYGISRANLEEDGVSAVESFKVEKAGRSWTRFTEGTLCYAYAQFFDVDGERKEGKTKLYMPLENRKFITNCTASEVGGLESLQKGGHLVLSKSYKDCRVLRNGGLNCVWLQNEGAVPSPEMLVHLARHAVGITVLFDSDEAGMAAAQRVSENINRLFPNRARPLWPPVEWRERFGAKDPSDIYRKMGGKHLTAFIAENLP